MFQIESWGPFAEVRAARAHAREHRRVKLRTHRRRDDSHRHELAIAGKLRESRDAFLAGKDWLTPLQESFRPPNNLLPWQVSQRLLAWCRDENAAAAEALRRALG